MSKSFLTLWSGQLISLLGSSLTGFGVSLWVYEQTQSAFLMSLAIFVKILPSIYMSLFAGPLIDRVSLKKAFIVSDSLLLAGTIALAAAQFHGSLTVYLLMPILFLSGVVESVQSLAFQTSVAHFNKPEFYLRSQGIVSFVENSPLILAPALGAIAYRSLGIEGIFIMDVISFFAALVTAAVIKFPKMPTRERKTHFLEGMRWISTQPLLIRLQAFFSASNFLNGLAAGVIGAFILKRSGGDANSWANVSTAIAIGSTAGALFLLHWKPKAALTTWITVGTALAAVFGRFLLVMSGSLIIWSLGSAVRAFLVPLISASNQTIWLKFVDRSQMGTVFGARRVLGQGAYPLAIYLGGWLSKSTDPTSEMAFLGRLVLYAGFAEFVVALLAYVLLRPYAAATIEQSSGATRAGS